MSRLLGALVLNRYAAVLLVKFERSVVADFARLHVVSSNVEQIMIRERDRCCWTRAMAYKLARY